MIRDTAAVIATAIGGILLLGAIVLGGWAAGWWFRAQDAQIGGQVSRGSYEFQQSRMDALSGQIADLTRITGQINGADPEQAAQLKAQRLAEAQQACRTARDITQPDPSEASWRDANCTAGAVSAASTYNN
ncbi:MAG: hypothetical protein JWO67_4489 [Streptosporangiaceae bacterium]|nr:hypothetical protein [Streptosporangiaceae bacterium]